MLGGPLWRMESASLDILSCGLQRGDRGFSKVEFLPQHFCGFEGCLASRIAESGVGLSGAIKHDANDLMIGVAYVGYFGPAKAWQR